MSTAGQIKDEFMHVSDIMPTILEVAEASYPETYKGKPVIQPVGKSGIEYAKGNERCRVTISGGGTFKSTYIHIAAWPINENKQKKIKISTKKKEPRRF